MHPRSPMPFGLGSWSSSPMDSGGPLFQLERADLPTVVAKRDPAPGGCQGGWEQSEAGRRAVRSESGLRVRSRQRASGGLLREPRNLGAVVSKIVLEPEGKRVRIAFDAPVDVVERPVRDVGDLGRVGVRLLLQPSEIDLHELVLVHADARLGLGGGEKAERQFARHAELLAEPAARREHRPFARARMAAAGIRPKPARVVLLRAALLQHDPPALVHHEDGKGAMQQPLAMDRCLASGTGGAIALIDQDELLFRHHGFFACRKSLTRTALPCERGTSPGALRTTSQVTPTIDLM